MSPRRRLVVLGTALLAVLLVIGILVPVLRARHASTGTGVAQSRPGPVLLVPGYGGGTGALDVLAGALRRSGRTAIVVPAIDGGTGDLLAQARNLQAVAAAQLAAGAPSVDVIGYSAGGVVTRIWTAELGGDVHVRRVVTLGSPFHGTQLAELGAATAPGSCPTACRQLVPGSDVLAGLQARPLGVPWTSVWTAQDSVVVPPTSAQLPGAVDIQLQRVCPDARVQHGTLPTDPLVVGIVAAALSGPSPAPAPVASACTALRSAGQRVLGGS